MSPIQTTEEALREQARLLDLTHDSIFVRDMDDMISYWNRGAEELYGWARDEAIGKVTHELMKTSFPLPLDQINTALLRDDRWEGELVHTKRDGTRVVVASRWALQRDAQGRPIAVLETNNDISERKRAERLTQQVFDSIPDMASIISKDYRYLRLNPAVERAWGVPTGSLTGVSMLSQIRQPEVFERFIKPNLDRCFAGEEVSFAMWANNAHGRRHIVTTFSPLRPDSDRVEAALAIGRDITEHVLASEALRTTQAELAHVTRVTMMGELTASIAHEIKQPLAAVTTNADAALRWLVGGPADVEEVRACLSRIAGDAARAGEVIARIRTLVKKSTLAKTPFDLSEIIEEALALVTVEARRHDVTLRSDLARDLPTVEGDRVQLQQVVLNLVINGIDAMKGVADRPRELLIKSRPHESSEVLVAVKDLGTGIDEASMTRLFEPFFTTKQEGMGMGLRISRSIIEAHDGQLWATRNPGPGITVYFTLPVGRHGP